MAKNGISVSEDIPYEVAKEKVEEVAAKMRALAEGGLQDFAAEKEYFKLEEEMVKYSTALMLTDEYAEEQLALQQKWEDEIESDNVRALHQLRRHMPVNVRAMTEEELTTKPTPNGKKLPKDIVKKFKRTNVLQLLRVDPDDLEKMHPSLIEGVRTTGLILTERRALHEHLKDVGKKWQQMAADKNVERKWMWHQSLTSKFKEMLNAYEKHVKEYGPPGNHPYKKRNDPPGSSSSGCPMIGNQCPVKANSTISYDDDYGFTIEAEYEISETKKSNLEDSSSSVPIRKPPTNNKGSFRATGANAAQKKNMDERIMAEIRENLNLLEPETEMEGKLIRELFFAVKRTNTLEKQLTQSGIAIPKEEISYAVAKEKIEEFTKELREIATKMMAEAGPKEMSQLERDYETLSTELEKYNNALMLTKEYAQEQMEKERV